MVLLCTIDFKLSIVGWGIFVIIVDRCHLVSAQEGKTNFISGFSSRAKKNTSQSNNTLYQLFSADVIRTYIPPHFNVHITLISLVWPSY